MRGDLLADARARVDRLQVRDVDPAADDAALRRLALWATRYTPAVSVWGEENGADGLFLDVSGAAHLFGGEEMLLADLSHRLDRFGLPARLDHDDFGSNRSKIMNVIDSNTLEHDVARKPLHTFRHHALAIADTPGAAWALSHYHPAPVVALPSGHEIQALAPLPVAALRLSPDTRTTLKRLGFKRIGLLIDKPRAPFAARFEKELLKRLDQALGRAPEPLSFIVPPPVYHSLRYLLEPIVSQDAVIAVATRLMKDLIHLLVRDGSGARELRLTLYRVDGEVTLIDIGLTMPTQSASHVARLIDLKLERLAGNLDADFGFEALGLAVTVAEPMEERQGELIASPDADREQCAALVDRLAQKLGPGSV